MLRSFAFYRSYLFPPPHEPNTIICGTKVAYCLTRLPQHDMLRCITTKLRINIDTPPRRETDFNLTTRDLCFSTDVMECSTRGFCQRLKVVL